MTTRRVFFGWWVALSFAVMAFLSSGIRFAVGRFLKPAFGSWLSGALFEATGGYAAAFVLASALLLAAAILSATRDERAHPLPRLAPLAGGK